ncbi:cell division protein SepF [Fodinisporobacter ferrooxydans]|uniref:Cell division protein SepF n=1 Tax=Fodinisporobacter ferrooxydans TaxID=2901836 RepID=A0ABY4CFN1_9BACL|nr:cell division protein SepF [Alicyclobacillaceae bacterium MYW30-H2]
MAQFVNKMLTFFGLSDDPEEEFQQAADAKANPQVVPINQEDAGAASRKGTVVSLHAQKQVKVVLCEPQGYDDAASIADHLRNRRSVIVNLHKSPYEQAVRIIDFLSGTTYALSGTMQKLGPQVFLYAPENVDIQGSISEILGKAPESFK